MGIMRKDNAGRERSASIGLVMLIKEEVVYCHARARREGCDRNDQLMDLYPSVFGQTAELAAGCVTADPCDDVSLRCRMLQSSLHVHCH